MYMLKINKLKVLYIVVLVLVIQFFINLDPFIFSKEFANNIVIRYFPLVVIFSLSLYKSEILNKIISKKIKLLISFFIGIIFSIILSLFVIDWYTYKIILTDFTICFCLYTILRNKFNNVPSIIITSIFGILYFLILNQATEFNAIIEIGEYSTFITNLALISMTILFLDDDIKNYFSISIVISIILIIIFYVINIVYAINVKSKIDDIDTTYNNLIQAINQKESYSKLKDIINIYPNFPKIDSDNGDDFYLAKPESPYTSIQISYNYVLAPSIITAIEDVEETNPKNNKKAYSDLKSTVSFLYDNLFKSDDIEELKMIPLKIFTVDFASNLLLIIIILLYRKLKC